MPLAAAPAPVSVRAIPFRFAWAWLLLLCASGLSSPFASAQVSGKDKPSEVFARVGSLDISVQDLAMALRTEAKRRFYHSKPPEEVLAAFRREVGDLLIERALAVQEARRRGIKVDKKALESDLDKYRARAAQSNPRHDNKVFWEALRKELEQEQLVARLRLKVHEGVVASDQRVKAYYESHPEKFTQPEQFHVSVILLRVMPSAGQAAWDAATREAQQIRERITKGADFADLARVHSADRSAARGGDMGPLHKGMLAPNVEASLTQLAEGAVTEPITVLEGVALFKIHARKPAKLGSYQEVRARATQLWLQEQQTQAWKSLLANLRASTAIQIEEKYLLTPG